MIVAGLQKLSLVDFPGKVAAVVFLQGCNFRCGYCHNPDLIKADGPGGLEEQEVLEYLHQRKKNVDAVVISGGEPTVHEDLPRFIDDISSTGLGIKLDTNGANPDVLTKLLSAGALDYVALDIKTSFRKYHLVSDLDKVTVRVKESIDICLNSDVPYEFRTTCVPGILEESDMSDIGEVCRGARQYVLQQFRPRITYDRSYSGKKPFDKSKIKSFKEILKEYVDKVSLRGV